MSPPPAHGILPDLLSGFEMYSVRRDMHGIVRALVVYLEFLYMQPVSFGTDRVAGLLLNIELFCFGLPWVTIPERLQSTLASAREAALVEGDVTELVSLAWSLATNTADGSQLILRWTAPEGPR